MKTHRSSTMPCLMVIAACLATVAVPMSVSASDDVPLYVDGPYAAVLGRFMRFDGDNPLDYGLGANVAAGLRRGPVAFEINGTYTAAKHSATLLGGTVDGLVFPFKGLPGLFAIVGAGETYVDKYPGIGSTTFNLTVVNGGVGYLLPLKFHSYQFGLRMQALYEYGKRSKREQDQRPPTVDLPIESNYHDLIANVGLQFPFGQVFEKVPPPEPPVTVVPVVAEAAAPPPPPPKLECRKPAPGERITLEGCGAGDVFVLNGVNFEFNKAALTPDAKTILDQVAGELSAHPDIQVELGGYTDSKGSDVYNQRLSERRAAAVTAYLARHGIDEHRMTSKGFGASMPIADNAAEEGRERNRRVELKIVRSDASSAAAPADSPNP